MISASVSGSDGSTPNSNDRSTPVVASAVGGIPEVVVDGETGLAFQPVNLLPLGHDFPERLNALVAENHPDREIARGLPPEAVKIATERVATINAAWERIAAERNLR